MTSGNRVPRAASLAVSISLLLSPAQADTETPRVVLGPAAKGLVAGPGMNAAGRNLRGSIFVGQDLSGAVFDGCNLYDVQIVECDLSGASFRDTVFSGALVGDCDIKGADFTNAVVNNNAWPPPRYVLELSPEQFRSTRSYRTKDLSCCVISGSNAAQELDFAGANLEHSWFTRGDFTRCDFTNADIGGITFANAAVSFEQLASTRDGRGRRLRVRHYSSDRIAGPVDLRGFDLDGSTFRAIPANWNFTDSEINGASLEGLTHEQLCSTSSYKSGDLSRVTVAYSDLSTCRFSGTNLTGARFGQCRFSGASFDDAVITGVNFYSVTEVPEGCDGLTADQIRSTWNFRHGLLKTTGLPADVAQILREEQAKQRHHR